MFRGLTAITIDSKGRIAIPTRYRSALQETAAARMVVTIDITYPCLLLYPLPAWEAIEETLSKLPSFNPATRRIQRLLIGHATECEMDRSGRILLPSLLREHAALDSAVMLAGQGNKFEIWSDAQWQVNSTRWLAEASINSEDDIPAELGNIAL